MHFNLLVACRSFAINPNTQLLSIIEVADQINSVTLPFTIPELCFVFQSVKLDSEPTEMPVECEVVCNGEILKTASTILKYGISNKNRYVLTSHNLQITSGDKLTANLYYNNRKNNVSISVDIKILPIPKSELTPRS